MNFILRTATLQDLPALLELEEKCFTFDRMTPRSFQWMLSRAHASLIVAETQGTLMGYALLLFHRGTSLARLYSLAISPLARGRGLGMQLLQQAQETAREHDCAYVRLEVRPDNAPAISLYEKAGYRPFAVVSDYYEDHSEALRFEKRITQRPEGKTRHVPYYQQTTEFTCGPACLLMAMAALAPGRPMARDEEVQIWREATTVFMTSGHGGCSPQGLALAAWRRGLKVRLQVSIDGPLFLNGVRSEEKKDVMRLVHQAFCSQLQDSDIQQIRTRQLDVASLLAEGGQPLVLISNYRLTRTKAPHWVLVTGCDEDFIYLHDPDIDHSRHREAMDCQYMPVSHEEFQRMSLFGGSKLRTSVILFSS